MERNKAKGRSHKVSQKNRKAGNAGKHKARRIYGIRIQLIGAFLTLVFLLIVLGMVSYNRAQQGITQNYEEAMNSSMNMMIRFFDTVCESAKAKNIQLANNETLQKYYGGEYAQDLTTNAKKAKEIGSTAYALAQTEKYISEIYVLGDCQNPIGAINNLLPKTTYESFVSSQDYAKVKEMKKSDTLWIGSHPGLDTIVSKKESTYSVACVRRLCDNYSKAVGYIIVDMKKEFVTDTFANSNLPEGSVAVLETQDGRLVGTDSMPDDFSIDQMKQGISNNDQYVNYNKHKYLFLLQPVESMGGRLCILIPQNVIMQQAEVVKRVTFVIVVIGVMIGLVLAFRMSNHISKTIYKVNTVLRKGTEGDLTQRVSDKSKDEFHTLSESVNVMFENMKGMVTQMDVSGRKVSESSGYMSEVSAQLLEASDQNQTAAHELGRGVSQQAEDISNCMECMNHLAENIVRTNDRMLEVDSFMQQTNETVAQSILALNGLREMDEETSNVTNTVADNVKKLSEKSAQISNFVDTINAIAENTNLLSLNASIEAARAGELGRGFGVVAEEIRKLSDQSKDASASIDHLISDMQSEMRVTWQSAESARKAVTDQERALQETVTMFEQIRSFVGKLRLQIGAIVGQMDEMGAAKAKTIGSIQSISAAVTQTETVSKNIEENAIHQMSVISRLNEVAKGLDEEYKEIDKIMKQFQI